MRLGHIHSRDETAALHVADVDGLPDSVLVQTMELKLELKLKLKLERARVLALAL